MTTGPTAGPTAGPATEPATGSPADAVIGPTADPAADQARNPGHLAWLGSRIKAFALFWYDFVVGDDWRIAAGVVAGLFATFVISRTSLPAWWVLPAGVALVLVASMASAAARSLKRHPGPGQSRQQGASREESREARTKGEPAELS